MKQPVKAEINTFVKGLISEASPLAFPKNASLDEDNWVLQPDGSRKRRLGIDLEDGFDLKVGSGDSDYQTFIWKNVNKNTGLVFLVVRNNDLLEFYDVSITPLSAGYKGFLSIASITPTLGSSWHQNLNIRVCSFSSIEGFLVIATGAKVVGVIEYTGTSFTLTPSSLMVRDLWGVQESDASTELDDTYQPTILTDQHTYNLHNQSWGIPRREGTGAFIDPVLYYRQNYPTYPSNSQTVWSGLQYTPVSGSTPPYERIFPNLFKEVEGVGVKAARGAFVIDLLNRGASRVASYNYNLFRHPEMVQQAITLPTDETKEGASIVHQYAGRLWFAGFSGQVIDGDSRSPNLSNALFFSQLVKNKNDINKCYQDGDPTTRENADVVDTDGGFIKFSDLDYIVALATFRDSLVVFGGNGIWRVFGGSDYGFSASNYKVEKISNKGCVSKDSVVTVNSDIYFWGLDGIFVITKNEFGDTVVNSITDTTIKTLFAEIPKASKYQSVGAYSSLDKQVMWVYKNALGLTVCLQFYTLLKAFSKHTFPLVGFIVNTAFVIDENSKATYLVSKQYGEIGSQYYKYTFASLKNPLFKDWDLVDAKAFCLTGSETANDTSSHKQIVYLITHFKKTESGVDSSGELLNRSGCKGRVQWNWASSADSNKWSELFTLYRYPRAFLSSAPAMEFAVLSTKNRVRGRGRAFSFYFETEPERDCHIYGWNITLEGTGST